MLLDPFMDGNILHYTAAYVGHAGLWKHRACSGMQCENGWIPRS
jgi:hypothetical protein